MVITDDNGQKTFDLRTHIRDPKTGATVKLQPYRLHISRERGTVFERFGIFYYPNGEKLPNQAPVAIPAAQAAPVNPEIEALQKELARAKEELKAKDSMLEELTAPPPAPVSGSAAKPDPAAVVTTQDPYPKVDGKK